MRRFEVKELLRSHSVSYIQGLQIALEAQGVRAVILDEQAPAYLSFAGRVRLAVPEDADYVRAMNEMHEYPRFYNTLTTNCTTTIATHSHVNRGAPPMSWKILLSGYVPQYAYDLGKLDRTLPFAELERRVWVNERAHAADRDPAFSQRIREVALR